MCYLDTLKIGQNCLFLCYFRRDHLRKKGKEKVVRAKIDAAVAKNRDRRYTMPYASLGAKRMI